MRRTAASASLGDPSGALAPSLSWDDSVDAAEAAGAATAVQKKKKKPFLSERGKTLLLAAVGAVSLVLLPALALLVRMPVLVTCNLSLLAGIATFFLAADELKWLAVQRLGLRGSGQRGAVATEGNFWALCAAFAAASWLGAPDSPLRWLHDWWGAAPSLLAVCAAAAAAHRGHRHTQRAYLQAVPRLPNRVSSVGMFLDNAADLFRGREKLAAVECAIRELERGQGGVLSAAKSWSGGLLSGPRQMFVGFPMSLIRQIRGGGGAEAAAAAAAAAGAGAGADAEAAAAPSRASNKVPLPLGPCYTVLETLQGCTADELNYLVRRLELGHCFFTLRDDHRRDGDGGKGEPTLDDHHHGDGGSSSHLYLHRTAVLELLCRHRLGDLKVRSRAMLLHGCQLARLPGRWACAVLCGTRGEELTQLKNYCDSKGDIHSLHKLVYEDLKGEGEEEGGGRESTGAAAGGSGTSSRKWARVRRIMLSGDVAGGGGGGGDGAASAPDCVRERVVDHIQREGRAVGRTLARRRLAGEEHPDRLLLGRLNGRKVLSDIDDTLFSSGGCYPAGCDGGFPAHSLYPGVTSFYRELDLSIEGASAWARRARESCGGLVFLSARPKVGRDHAVERSSHRRFARYREEKMLHTTPSMLAGSLGAGIAMMGGGNLGPTAAKKYENFAAYASLYPEYKFLFIGDNGQADVAAAELMADAFKGRIEAVYIHQVKPIEETFGYEGPQTLAKWRRMGVHFFSTYVGAAVHAASVTTSSNSAAAGAACVGGVASSGGGGGGGCAEEGGASGGAIYDGGGQLRTAPLMYPQAVRRIALQAVAQCEHACAPGQQGGWEELRGRPVRSGGDTWQLPWRARREMYARLLNRDVAAANALLAGARAAEAEASRGCAWFEAAGAAAMQRSLRPVRLAALPPMLSVGCAVCHRLTGQPAVVVAHGDIPSHSSEAKRHHRSFSMRLETASSTSSNMSLLRAAKGHREGAAGGLDDTTTTDTAEPLPSNRARRVESLVDGVQEVQ